MRRILDIVAFMALILGMMGCALDNPVDTHPLSSSTSFTRAYQPFALPADPALKKGITVTGTITAAQGGTLAFSHANGGFSIHITLAFGPGSVASDLVLDMIADDEMLAASFGPEGTAFLKPGDLSICATGLELGEMDQSTLLAKLRLLYQNEDTGVWEEIPAASFDADPATGSVMCEGGVIWHFSRYGFGI